MPFYLFRWVDAAMKRQARRQYRKISAADRAKYDALRKQLDSEKGVILAEARRHKAAHDAAAGDLRKAFELLKAERLSQGLSLSDIRDRTGIGRSAISRLENDPQANPTIATLTRYADALGKRVAITLIDQS
jgi:hypothetical protein